MRIEKHHGQYIVCGHIFPIEEIDVGEIWQASGGATVEIISVDADKDSVKYRWTTSGGIQSHSKSSFAFQCRYCKIVNA